MQSDSSGLVAGRAKRGRGPSPAKTAATRQALVEAGLAAFLENGFSGTKMGDVAAQAGVAKGTAYLHFADKAALFTEVLRQFVRDAVGRAPIARPLPDEGTGDFFRRAVVPVVRALQATDRFRVLHLVIAEGSRFPELAAVYRTEAIDPVLRMVRIYLARAKRRGELRVEALGDLPALLVSPILLGVIWNNLFVRDDPLDVANLLETFLCLSFRPTAV